MSEAGSPNKSAVSPVPSLPRHIWRARVSPLLLPVLMLVGLLTWSVPWLLWAYNVEEAGQEMDVGLQWPEPRLVDSLPANRDDQALQTALRHLEAAIRWRPRHAHAYRLQGQVYAARRDWTKAATSFEQARDFASGNPLLTWESTLIYEQIGDTAQTSNSEPQLSDTLSASTALTPEVRMLQAWHDLGLDATRLLNLGKEAQYRGDYNQALRWFERAVVVAPDWGEPWYRMGLVYKIQQQPDKAQAAWVKAEQVTKQAAQRSPDDRDVWYLLGQVYVERMQWDAALEAFDRGLQATSGNVGMSNLYLSIGSIQHFALSPPDLDGAWAAYQQALDINHFSDELGTPSKARTHHSRGLILASEERWDAASEEFQKAVSLADYESWFRVSLARSLWHSGQPGLAREHARQALELYPRNADAYHLLGDISAAEGNVAEARAMYAQALDLAPWNDTARKALEKLGR